MIHASDPPLPIPIGSKVRLGSRLGVVENYYLGRIDVCLVFFGDQRLQDMPEEIAVDDLEVLELKLDMDGWPEGTFAH